MAYVWTYCLRRHFLLHEPTDLSSKGDISSLWTLSKCKRQRDTLHTAKHQTDLPLDGVQTLAWLEDILEPGCRS
jgi:hypothetical protein